MNETEVQIIVGDLELSRWLDYSIESDLLLPADAFALTASNADGALAGKLTTGAQVEVLVDGTRVHLGHIDQVAYRTEQKIADVTIRGRDIFGCLVDCSAAPAVYRRMTLKTLAERLTGSWVRSWAVTTGTSLAVHDPIKVEPGQTVWDVLSRLAQRDEVLLWCAADGTGVIGRPDYEQDATFGLQLAKASSGRAGSNNLLSSSTTDDWAERFSTIRVVGTTGNTAANYGKNAAQKAEATDSAVGSSRLLVISDGDVKSLAQARNRAALEVARRRFDGETVNVTVRGHYGRALHQPGERLYEAGLLADLVDEASGKNGTYLITRRRFRGDDQGRYTDLTLHPAGVWMA